MLTYTEPWILRENKFNPVHLGKTESVMSQGNGYMGLRAAAEEQYTNEKRGLFVAGTFNKFDHNEVTELPNGADLLRMEFFLNRELFSLEHGKVENFQKELHLKTGELRRSFIWQSPRGSKYEMCFFRIVSLADLHTIAQKVTIMPIDGDMVVNFTTGIDAQMTNSGSQHFSEGAKRFYDQQYMQLVATTTESNISFVYSSDVKILLPHDKQIGMDRRRIFSKYCIVVHHPQTLSIEKISTVHTTRDKENLGVEELQKFALDNLKKQSEAGYDEILEASAAEWNRLVWENTPIEIDTDNVKDQLAINFAQYHLQIMAPAHDERMNIAAKGLSGEGYKGHTFWDTEIFALPYYTFTQPKTARSLLKYRFLSLDGARKKANGNGYSGAQYPWESAWPDSGEVTPLYGAADIVTGLPIPILTGFIEIHITCDVVYGIWHYYQATGDEEFMRDYGYEIIFETANFWASRLETGEDGLLHINNVIGPDEYKDGIDDDAFTNYFAKWNLELAVSYYNVIKSSQTFSKLSQRITLDHALWKHKAEKIYIPLPNANGIIPQNSTFLSLKRIDLTKYRNSPSVGTIYNDYNHEQIGQIQVCKQADVLLLLLLMESNFSEEVKKANWDYYESITLHDSSLSLSTHSILANDMNDSALAYQLFERAYNIDMGPNLTTSNDGIHAGSIGGIWQCIIYGFAGLRIIGDSIRLRPALPPHWRSLTFHVHIKNEKVKIKITPDSTQIPEKHRHFFKD